ncbi:SusC/RagA family TonB-linked outer membrane protein [Algoriphagus winogradskyi]|uniref:TonB-linked outer membrane protein, SusC/RagA family n=1 Tax=Algoriphagus winogradskyi TaxID=237017 RepID=A0ABY1NYF2_9BACT|nr:SusC/RagA family TonB-linked outer membrane protein [Algoriphagus winogradskyi]SMP21559.1 TonB-linked outer membrane protein, SusC/RagA family [Algoriphagus winogradskyi]
MRKFVLLLCMSYSISWFASAQVEGLIASEKNLDTFSSRSENRYLKEVLTQFENKFKVSIAYKDELVQSKRIKSSKSSFSSVEEGLKVILRETGLSYEKAGENFYVIFQSRSSPTAKGADLKNILTSTQSPSSAGRGSDLNSRISRNSISTIERRRIEITGRVTDENGMGFPGVNILLKGTSTGTVSGNNGNYTINVESETSVLVFSFVGYLNQEEVVGNRSVVNISMQVDASDLEEVVVTALGIEKSAKSLGYATSTVKSDELTINRTPNVMNALQGKVAGVSISALGSGPGGTSKIRIRGQSSISGQNNPLIVVNGVPIDNTNFGSNPGNNASDSSIGVRGGGNTSDGGDGLSSINPDDVQSMTILKGAAAAALYGSRAKDGVVMITTKTKNDSRGMGVTYNLNYTNEAPLDFTDYQYEYGQGEQGIRPTTPNPTSGQWSFGEKFAPGMTQMLFDGITVPYEPVKGIINDFFRNGQNVTNSITLATSTEKGGMSLSFSDLNSKGIVPNNVYNRKTINLGFAYDLSPKFSFRGNFNYSHEENENPPNIGQQDNTIPVALYNMANSMPLDVLRDNRYDANGNEAVYSRFRNRTNPYFTLSDQFQNIRRDRIFGNLAVKYQFTDWLFVQGRVGQDFWTRDQDYNNFPTGQASRAPAPAGFVNGVYTQEQRRFREINTDFLINANKEFGDFGINANIGGNHMQRRSDLNSVQVTDFVVRDLYTVQNGRAKDPIYDLNERAVNSLYGSAEVSYKDMLFLTGTIRNDWFSTLSRENRSILYPSLSASWVFTENFAQNSWLNFGKLRVAYAEVGSDADVGAYSNVLFYGINNNLFGGQPVGGPNGTNLPNPNLRPMRIGEAEVGFELRMFQGKVSLDMAAYRKLTTDQIVSAQISDASGFVNTSINSGQSENKGIEMLLTIVPIENKNFTWEFSANSAYNKTKVLSLLTDNPGERITVGTHVFNGELRQIVGMEMGQVAGFGYRRDDQGRKIFGANGLPLRTTDLVNFGSALPNWVGGFNNSLNYKGVMLSFLIDYKLGNIMLSGTNFNATRHGLHKMTLEGREGGVVGVGVNEAGEINTAVAPVQSYWEVVRSQALVEPIIYDGGYVKLRQITLGYDFTKHLPENQPFKSVKLNFVANNVFMIKKWVDNIDPESFGYSSDNLVGMESTGLPSTRGLGFNLNVKF